MTNKLKLLILLSISLALVCVCDTHKSVQLSRPTKTATLKSPDMSKLVGLRGGKTEMSSFQQFIETIKNFFKSFFQSSEKNNKSNVKSKNKSKSKSKATTSNKSTKSTGDSRIQREIKDFIENPPLNCELEVGSNVRSWIVNIVGLEGTIYAGEKFKLKMVFPKDYPSKPPSVYFLKPTPKHVHVYSNGDICLNLLGRDWRPTMTASMLVISIISMLSSAKEKKSPQDNALHSDSPPGQQQEGWMYHDDRC